MSRSISWLIVTVLLAVFATVATMLLLQRAEAGRDMPAYSVFSRDETGLAPTADLLRRMGYEPVAVTSPIQHSEHRGLLIMVEPGFQGSSAEIDEGQARSILRWVERGNTLLVAGRHTNGLHRLLHVEVVGDRRAEAGDTFHHDAVPEDSLGYTAGIGQLEVSGEDYLDARSSPLVLWTTKGKPGAVVVRRGKGRVIFVADPSMLTVRGLRRKDNVLFLYNLALLDAQDGRVYFDEYHHGIRSGSGFWAYLRYRGQSLAVLPLLLFLLVTIWSLVIRLGRPIVPAEGSKADAVDYASSIARIYQQAGVRRLPGMVLIRDLSKALCRHLRIRRTAVPAVILAAWQQRYGKEAGTRVQQILRTMSELRSENLEERRLLQLTQEFGRFETEVLRAK